MLDKWGKPIQGNKPSITSATPTPVTQPVQPPQYQTMYAPNPAPKRAQLTDNTKLNNYWNSEIQKKANMGQALDRPSPEKQALYDQWTNFYTQEAQRKAQNNEQLQRPNDFTQGVWNQTYNDTVSQAQRDALSGVPNSNNNAFTKEIYDKFKLNTDEIDFEKYRTESATIADLAEKYGFDYSRDYAKRQAEAEAQARRNANADAQRRNESNRDLNKQNIDNELMNMAEGLDRNYFQQYMQQAQNQVDTGLNSGIAADQDLRLAMSRQAEMGGAYRDANLGKMREDQRFTNDDLRLAEELGLINQQALAYEEQLYNDRLGQAFDQIQQLNQFSQSENLAMLDAAFRQRDMNMTREMDWRDYYRQVLESDRDFGFQQEQADRQFGLDEGALTGRYATPEQQKHIQTILDAKRRIDVDKEILSAEEKATVAQARQALASSGMNIDYLSGTTSYNDALRGLDVMLGTQSERDSVRGNKIDWANVANQRRQLAEQRRQFDESMNLDRDRFREEQAQNRFSQETWSAEFEEDKRRFGLEYALNKQVQLGNLSLSEAELELRRQGQEWDQNFAEYQFNNMSASDAASLAEQVRQFDRSMALQVQEIASMMEQSGIGYGDLSSTQQSILLSAAELTGGYSGGVLGSGSSSLGSLSATYESNGDPGAINPNDNGSPSYGAYQLNTNAGHAKKFAKQWGGRLASLDPHSQAFMNEWRSIAKSQPEKFKQAQHNYIAKEHYQPMLGYFQKATGMSANNYSNALKNVLWSIGVQHGPSGQYVVQRAGIKKGDSETSIINKLYNERSKVDTYFASSSAKVKQQQRDRFAKERAQALAMLKNGSNNKLGYN